MADVTEITEPQEAIVPEAPAEPELIRVVVVDRCGPSPARCLYGPGFTYNVPPDEAEWLFEHEHAYKEGDPPLEPLAVRLERQRRDRELLEEQERHAQAARVLSARAARKLARERASDMACELAQKKSAELEAAKEVLRLAEEERAAAEAAAQALAELEGGE